jgi:hypothetical protein
VFVASVASTVSRNVTLPAQAPVGPFAYCLIMLNVHATSSAVSGSPSDQVASGRVSNVTVRPSADCDQSVAKLGRKSYAGVVVSYWRRLVDVHPDRVVVLVEADERVQ